MFSCQLYSYSDLFNFNKENDCSELCGKAELDNIF